MYYTYINTSNITGAGESLNPAGQDAYVKKVIFGNPTDGVGLKIYNKSTAHGHASSLASTDTTNIALYFVQPSHAAGCNWVYELNLSGEFNPGLQVDGGSVHTDSSKVTVIWDDK